jgi:hypothetical protein
MQYWYTAQLRNYRLQFIRAFSNFYIQTGPDANGVVSTTKVPCRYGDPSRIASTIVAGNSENKLLSTPFISCTVSGLNMNANRRQDPTFVGKIQVNERAYDDETKEYLETIGNRYTVERYMPVPYDLKMQVDIWTSNTSIKEQLLEQILTLYNPSIDMQTSTNGLDWTFLSRIEMEDQITWSSRTIPMGTDNPIDVMTLQFLVPIWINPPAKVQKQKIIEEIITNIVNGSKDDPEQYDWTEYEFLNRHFTTVDNRSIALSWAGNNSYSISLRSQGGDPVDHNHLPTVVTSSDDPVLTVGTSFRFNNIVINITNPDLSSVVAAGEAALANTSYTMRLFNKRAIQFIDNSGGNISLSNVVGQPVQDLGLMTDAYIGGTLSWPRLFEAYGSLKDYNGYGTNASQLRLRLVLEDPDQDIVGWIEASSLKQNLITWHIDPQCLPVPTLHPITAIVDPGATGPGYGLSNAAVGQRYLLLATPSTQSEAWGLLPDAKINDIIEFDGQRWKVSFDSMQGPRPTDYVINQYSGKLLVHSAQGWSEYINKSYAPGEWRLAL